MVDIDQEVVVVLQNFLLRNHLHVLLEIFLMRRSKAT